MASLPACERPKRAREREAAERARTPAPPPRAAPALTLEPPLALTRVADSGLPCAVDDVLASKCRRCHGVPPRHGAPLPLMTWDDTRQDRLGEPVYSVLARVVQSGFMPYRIEANPPVAPLTEAEKSVLVQWARAGAPRGDCGLAAPSASAVAPGASAPHAAPGKRR